MNESSSPTGFVAPEPSELAPLFPGYEIHDLIATGGMGAVYRAVQKSLDRTVALKILPLEFSEDAEFCAGFEAEAKAMARLNHPNLIGVHDFGEVNGMLFIVMEFVRGKSLYHSANGRTIEPREAARLVTGICNGLAHAHENGILHRDIKPSNILLTPQAEPKIGDFGLARPVETKTQAGEVIFGTPGYTAPEVVDAPETVDHRADLFSVGVLLHELLTGRLPADDPRPASLISGCDVRFDAIIRRATNAVPAIRYSSAAEIAAELQTITSARATSPIAKAPAVAKGGVRRPPQPVRNASAGAKRKSMNLTWIGPLVAISIMAFSWYTFINMKPRVMVIDDPAAKLSSAGSSEGEVDPFASSAGLQASRPTPPSVSNVQELVMPEVKPINGNPHASPQSQLTKSDFTGDWDSQKSNGRVRIQENGEAICYRYKDRNRRELLKRVESTWKQGEAPNQIVIWWEKNPRYHNTWTMNSSGDSLESVNQLGHRDQFSRTAKAESPVVPGEVDKRSVATNPSPSILSTETRARPSAIPPDAKLFNGKRYFAFEKKCNWTEASRRCESMGGQLVVIADVATQKFIEDLAAHRVLWLGATDKDIEGKWRWVDGTEMKFKNFGKGQPDNWNGLENWLSINWKANNGEWNDVGNDRLFGYICEWPTPPAEQAAPVAGGVLPQPARGAGFGMGFSPTLDVVGTWKYSDTVQLEIRPDGTVFSDAKPIGKWTRRDNILEYFIVFNDRSEYIATLDKYKRILRTASRERGVGKSMERIDDGPTKNPNIPDRTTALKMECSDLETEIKSMEARLEDPKTNKSQAGNLEWNIRKCRQSLVELKSKIGMN